MKMLVLCAALLISTVAKAASVKIVIDDSAARAVLKAVRNPNLTREQALALARLPGNEGLIEKLHSYNKPSDEGTLADALLATARNQPEPPDDEYQFNKVRDNAVEIKKTLNEFVNPSNGFIAEVSERINQFSLGKTKGKVTGYIIAGGTSGGFSFGKPVFFLNLARYPSPQVAQIILEHELYHGVQGLALSPSRPLQMVKACLAALPRGETLAELFSSLYAEGTASYVGDVLRLPDSQDPVAEEQRSHLQTNVARVERSVTLLELSVHAIVTSNIDYEKIYALGFYDDEILYALGYVMAKEIVARRGPSALADLLNQPPTQFVLSYVTLPTYGKSEDAPKLGDETIQWASKSKACGA